MPFLVAGRLDQHAFQLIAARIFPPHQPLLANGPFFHLGISVSHREGEVELPSIISIRPQFRSSAFSQTRTPVRDIDIVSSLIIPPGETMGVEWRSPMSIFAGPSSRLTTMERLSGVHTKWRKLCSKVLGPPNCSVRFFAVPVPLAGIT